MQSVLQFLASLFAYPQNNPMLFTQTSFWIFFGIVLFLFSLVYRNIRNRNVLLLLVSLFFYYKCGGTVVLLLAASVGINYLAGRGIGSLQERWKRKSLLILSLLFNLGLLVYFKYTGFFLEILHGASGIHIEPVNLVNRMNAGLGIPASSLSSWIIPLGISFFTFHLISYTVEVYRRHLPAITWFPDFALYITFFPQLTAGPISKANQFIPQIAKPYRLSTRDFGIALFLILSGLLKKLVIADYISLNFVERVFENPELYTGFESLLAIYGYTLQIYCDFSGYTDMAIGIAGLLGFQLPDNFNSPYKARSISDFWKRWHMSLTLWLRDYLFLPVAYYISGKLKKYRYLGIRTDRWIYVISTLITFTLCGLWHGAAVNFILWGALHGLLLILDKFIPFRFTRKGPRAGLYRAISVFFTFHLIVLSWLVFKIKSPDTGSLMLDKIFSEFHPELMLQIVQNNSMILLLMLLGFAFHWLPDTLSAKAKEWFIQSHYLTKVLIAFLCVILIYQFQSAQVQPFIYYNF